MPVSEKTYRRVALEDPEGKWELWCGQLRRKPGMTTDHNEIARRLQRRLVLQVDERDYSVATDNGRVRISGGTFYVPDLCVIPRALVERLRREQPAALEVYDEPLPLVVEMWSPSTGGYDVEHKLREYQRRGDAEIWRIHPRERTLTARRRQPDGSYTETVFTGGVVEPVALPGVRIVLDELFA
jgi:Uma2 family endonuclease